MTPANTAAARIALIALACVLALPATAWASEAPSDVARLAGRNPSITTRSGLEIHKRFRQHLAEPDCANASPRWRAHFAHAPKRLATRDDELLAVFGYVVDELVKAGLPTEYALIPFVESGYKPGARSSAGPAGLWQFIAITARNQGVPMPPGYDGRYSVVESTRAAVRYLKILHSMFGGNWRVAIMGYNAGEYRLIGAIKRSGMSQRNADPKRIQGMPSLTLAYVEKLHALSCLIEQADDRKAWLDAVDRPVPVLAAEIVEQQAPSLEAWSRDRQLDAGLMRRLNPALASGTLAAGKNAPWLLAPIRAQSESEVAATPTPGDAPAAAASTLPVASAVIAPSSAADALSRTTAANTEAAPSLPREHVVAKGESWWSIARRYRISSSELMRRSGLKPGAPLRPGMVLKLDAETR